MKDSVKILNKKEISFEIIITVYEKYLLASYEVPYCIAINKRQIGVGEDLVLPVANKMIEMLP